MALVADYLFEDSAAGGNDPWGSNAEQTLLSVDSRGFDDGGHMTIYVTRSGEVRVRHQADPGSADISYQHLLCDRHERIHAGGAWAESLLPGARALLAPQALAS